MFSCRFCRIETNTWKDHLKHLIEDHSDSNSRLYCGFNGCRKAISSESHMVTHLFKVHAMSVQKGQTIISDILDKNYECTVHECPFAFENYNILIKHLKSHIFNGISVRCPFSRCGMRYSHEWFFERHLRVCHVAVLDDFWKKNTPRTQVYTKIKQENDCESMNECQPLDLSSSAEFQQSFDEINNNSLPLTLSNYEKLTSQRHLDILQQASFIKTSLQLNKKNLKKKKPLPSSLQHNIHHTKRMLHFMRSVLLPWHRFPEQLLNSCDNRERAGPAEIQLMINEIADYLCCELKDKSLEIVVELADKMCQEYPFTFASRVDDSHDDEDDEAMQRSNWLAARIYAAANSRRDFEILVVKKNGDDHQNVSNSRQRKRKAAEAFGHNHEMENRSVSTAHKVCGAGNTQMSIGLLQQPKYFLMYASSLLGIDVSTTWCRGLSQNQIIYDFMMTERCSHMKEQTLRDDDLAAIFEEFSIVECLQNDQARTIAIFPLIIKYFNEDPNFLYTVLDSETPDEVMNLLVRTTSPILVVRGKSLYDVNASCVVFIKSRELMRGVNVLQGFLIVFLSYFVFRIEYSRKLQKTLQVIQRLIMDINPVEGNHGRGERPQYKSIHIRVRKFIDQLKIFKNHGRIIN